MQTTDPSIQPRQVQAPRGLHSVDCRCGSKICLRQDGLSPATAACDAAIATAFLAPQSFHYPHDDGSSAKQLPAKMPPKYRR